MTDLRSPDLRVLVVIASYGTSNDGYLEQVIRAYRSMPFEIDIVVCSNIAKNIPGVENVAGLPTKNPRSLPYAHKRIFAERLQAYDLFVYSEDDILITETNIRAFLTVSASLAPEEVAGLLRIEKDPGGRSFFPDFHNRFHWDPESVCIRGMYTFAYFTNEHAGCYLMSRSQLKRAIASGGWSAGPREEKYEMLETAATDAYTRCGFRKLICISDLKAFLVHHLPNKYIGTMALADCEVYRQTDTLMQTACEKKTPSRLFKTGPKSDLVPFSAYYSKSYYEPARAESLSLIPENVRSVLSVGCGWGAAEKWLVEKGVRVVGVPLDSVIAACAGARGVEIVHGDPTSAREALSGDRFDCLWMSNVLHLVKDPVAWVMSFATLLADDGTVIAVVPNRLRLGAIWASVRGGRRIGDVGGFESTGVHFVCRRVLSNWMRSAGLRIEKVLSIVPGRAQALARASFGFMNPFLASELIIVARKPVRRAAATRGPAADCHKGLTGNDKRHRA